ncbi:hypothetical protein [Microcoleus sp. T3B2]|uniref:hypothetical protein n=1 Tax=Microcoleus sp. T3B2 TaxID=3055426 RepID=UPI002FCFFA94
MATSNVQDLMDLSEILQYFNMFFTGGQVFYGRALLPNPYSPQENSLFVEQASCLFLKMVKDVRFN